MLDLNNRVVPIARAAMEAEKAAGVATVRVRWRLRLPEDWVLITTLFTINSFPGCFPGSCRTRCFITPSQASNLSGLPHEVFVDYERHTVWSRPPSSAAQTAIRWANKR
jgi:hypothetical protein